MTEYEISPAAQVFRIKRQISQTKQGTADVTTYFNVLKRLLVELDLYQNIEFESAADAKKVKNLMGRDRVIQFLVGLNPEYDRVCNRVLAKEPFPDLEEAFVLARDEESNKGLKNHIKSEIGRPKAENSVIGVSLPMSDLHGWGGVGQFVPAWSHALSQSSISGSQMPQTAARMNPNLLLFHQQRVQSGNNNPLTSILMSQPASSKYVKFWEGNLSALREGQPVFITRLEGFRKVTSSDTLAGCWPVTMQISNLISQDHMNNKNYVGKADFLLFRAIYQHGFIGQLQEKKLCAVIKLPSQTLLLAVSDEACRWIGMLLPEDVVVFAGETSSQQQQQEQRQQQLLPQLQQLQLSQLQQQRLPELQQQQQPTQLQQQPMRQLQQQLQLLNLQQQPMLQSQQRLPGLKPLSQLQLKVGIGMGQAYAHGAGRSHLVSEGQASSQVPPTMPGGGFMS